MLLPQGPDKQRLHDVPDLPEVPVPATPKGPQRLVEVELEHPGQTKHNSFTWLYYNCMLDTTHPRFDENSVPLAVAHDQY